MPTQEFLEEMVKETKKYVPGWLYSSLLKAARARAGGRVKAQRRQERKEHEEKEVTKAIWTRAFINDLPDDSFLYVEPGGEKDEDGKTVPRTLRHFPFMDSTGKVDLPHLRNALARISQSKIPDDEKDKAREKAERILEQQKERMSKADVAFVVSSLEPVEKARKEPLVGDAGITFRDKYLNPLGFKKDEGAIVLLTDVDQLYDIKPRVVVALGKQAAAELGELADFMLPHPKAVHRRDSGEVARKIRAIEKFLVDSIIKREYFCERHSWLWPTPREVEITESNGDDFTQVQIQKAHKDKRIVYGVVLDPYGKEGPQADAHNDWTPPSEIEKTAHGYMKGSRVIGMQHGAKAEANVVESWVEPYPSRKEYLKAMNDEPHSVNRRAFGDDVLHSGAWVMGVELGHDEWKAFERGDINAFSPGGVGFRSALKEHMMPEVTFIDLEPKDV